MGEGLVLLKSYNNKIKIVINNQSSNLGNWLENIYLNFKNGKVLIKMPAPLIKNKSAQIFFQNYNNNKKYKGKVKNGWSFKNQAKYFVDYIMSNKIKKSQCNAKDGLADIKIIEEIFNN